jgi:hypothetical protein
MSEPGANREERDRLVAELKELDRKIYPEDDSQRLPERKRNLLKDRYHQVLGEYSEGRAAVKKDGRWGYIDLDGREAVPFELVSAGQFGENLSVVGRQTPDRDYHYGVIDRGGRTVVPFEQRNLFFIADGVATCSRVDDVARARGAYQELQGILRIERPANTGD